MQVCTVLWGHNHTRSRAREVREGGICLLTFSDLPSLASRCVGGLKPVPQAEAPGYLNRSPPPSPPPQEDWGCVSFCCLRSSTLEVVALPGAVHLFVTFLWSSGTPAFWPPGQGAQGVSPVRIAPACWPRGGSWRL